MILLQLYCYDMLKHVDVYIPINYLLSTKDKDNFILFFLSMNQQPICYKLNRSLQISYIYMFWCVKFSIKIQWLTSFIYINELFCIPLSFLQQHCCVTCKIFFDAKKYVSFRLAIFLHQFTKEHIDWTKNLYCISQTFTI